MGFLVKTRKCVGIFAAAATGVVIGYAHWKYQNTDASVSLPDIKKAAQTARQFFTPATVPATAKEERVAGNFPFLLPGGGDVGPVENDGTEKYQAYLARDIQKQRTAFANAQSMNKGIESFKILRDLSPAYVLENMTMAEYQAVLVEHARAALQEIHQNFNNGRLSAADKMEQIQLMEGAAHTLGSSLEKYYRSYDASVDVGLKEAGLPYTRQSILEFHVEDTIQRIRDFRKQMDDIERAGFSPENIRQYKAMDQKVFWLYMDADRLIHLSDLQIDLGAETGMIPGNLDERSERAARYEEQVNRSGSALKPVP